MPNKWSELHTDVLQSILERLSIISYLKAQCVCKNWYIVCKKISSKQEKFPWIINFPRRRPKSSTCQVFNPQEGKIYTLRNLGSDFSTHQCIATSGSWLLMLDVQSNLYVLNVFTRERIELPALESHKGRLQVHRLQNNTFTFIINQSSVLPASNVLNRTKAVLWVDEKTKGYIVVWSIGLSYIMYTMSGFYFWREIPTKEGPEILHGCQDIVYKYNKLYVLSRLNRIRILDFSQELPRALHDNVDDDPFRDERRRGTIGVTLSGEVLMVKNQLNQVFYILKTNSEGTNWDEVEELEGEAWITDLGVTVPAVDGTTRPNSIYYRDRSLYCGDLSIQVLEMVFNVHKDGHARWFIPRLRSCN